jgi:RNA polymerase sigma-70 factor (ECF subfamily)
LVRDESLALQVVQDTFLTALQQPPSDASNPAKVRAWLSRVLGNRVRDTARHEERRRERQRCVTRREQSVSMECSIDQIRVHKELVSAVLELREPYHEVIVLRYFDDLSVASIAKRLSLQAGTVRTRCSRALTMLRARLDSRHEGGRQAWTTLLSPGMGLPESPLGTATTAVFSKVFWEACLPHWS